ncbi:MAG TPA: G1 family glutamic endopeptidase, partial [Acidimicrobiales bacterium]|nr:G1 family glutamic endopeptidase [Acidimicrobiales bacterium]
VVYSYSDDTITITVDDTTSGDSLVAVVSDSAAADPDTYTLTVDGNSSGPDAFRSGLCGPSDPNGPCGTSAEWVVEAPSGAPGGLYPLARYRPITFQSANAVDAEGNQGSILSPDWNTDALDLTTEAGLLLARVSGLNKPGTSFTDTWVRK